MANINENYLNLQGSYLFANIAKKVNEYQTEQSRSRNGQS